jgi:hypothetical protein
MLILMIKCITVLSIEHWIYMALLDHLLRHTFVPRIQYLGFTTRGKNGPLTTMGDLSACKTRRTLIQLLTVNKPLFLAPLPGDLTFYCFFVIFSFLLVFLFASTKLWSSSNQSNLVCLTLVFLDLFLLFCLSLTQTGDGWLALQQTQ